MIMVRGCGFAAAASCYEEPYAGRDMGKTAWSALPARCVRAYLRRDDPVGNGLGRAAPWARALTGERMSQVGEICLTDTGGRVHEREKENGFRGRR